MVSAARLARNRRTVANVIALGQGGGAATLPVTLPVAPSLFISSARLAGYNGAPFRGGALNGTHADVPFVGDRSDPAFGAGIHGVASTLYDQSGNGNHLVQSAPLGQAKVSPLDKYGDAQPFVSGANIVYPLPAGYTLAQDNHTVLMLMAVGSSGLDQYLELGSGSGASALRLSSLGMNSVSHGVLLFNGSGAAQKVSNINPRSGEPVVIGYSSGPADVKFLVDRHIVTASGALPSGSLIGGKLQNSAGYCDILALAIIPRALSEAELQDAARALEAIARPRELTAANIGIVLISDSLGAGQPYGTYSPTYGANGNISNILLGLLSPSDRQKVAMFNLGYPTQTVANMNTFKTNYLPALMAAYPAITRWVGIVGAGGNDLRGGSTGSQVITRTSQLTTYLKDTLGFFRVAVGTMNKIGDSTFMASPTAEPGRQQANADMLANFATTYRADAVINWDGIPELQDVDNLTYFVDKVHGTPAQYGLKANLTLPFAQGAIAA